MTYKIKNQNRLNNIPKRQERDTERISQKHRKTSQYASFERDENEKLNKVLRNGLRIRVECDIT